MISVLLNDEPMCLDKGSTVEAMVRQLEVGNADRVAVAVNDQVVSRDQWSRHELTDQDRVLLIAPIQGG